MLRENLMLRPLLTILAVTGLAAAIGDASSTDGTGASGTGTGGTGTIQGRLLLDLPGVRLAQLGPTVAYLDAARGELAFEVPRRIPRISQAGAKFHPSFLTVVAGQTVEMINDDGISHNVFSLSPGSAFDLGVYPRGTSKSVTLRQPGMVRVYCSIHASMNATIFVAPSPYHTAVNGDGSFEIRRVPPGEYRLEIWSRKLPRVTRLLEVVAGDQEITVRVGLGRDTGAD